MSRMLRRLALPLLLAVSLAAAVLVAQTQTQTQSPGAVAAPARTPAPDPTNLVTDANGNTMRRALKTGHVSNYDESKVKPYTLPNPLIMANGQPVRSENDWRNKRRPEIIKLYEDQIFGHVPPIAPRVTWEVADTDPKARDGAALMKHVVGRIGDAANAPRINMTVYTPAAARKPVPLILVVNFGGGDAGRAAARGPAPSPDPPVAADILARGWGYAMFGYQDIQPDRANALTQGAIGLTLAPGASQPAPDEWGAISAWAWGVSRAIDYLETDKSVNGSRIALEGFSRVGKTALWATAKDQRIAAVLAACAGEMGSALSRRDWGETVDDMAQNFPYWFATNFQRWPGRWNEMPVDAHMLIALAAPRPVFLTGGTADQWSDPKGEFLAGVAAGPVYRLLGRKDLGTTDFPAPDTPLTSGEIGWVEHTGPHALTAGDWTIFLNFLGKYFK